MCFRILAHDAVCPRHGAAPLCEEPQPAAASFARPAVPGYGIVELLGAGAHATVWHARRRRDDTEVAIKLAMAGTTHAQERAERERKMLARVGAPHVPALLDHGVLADGRAYLVMERLMGPSLGTRLSQMRAPPAPERAAALADAFLTALAAMHRAGIAHRDIKADNVVIEHENDAGAMRAVLLDLGLAHPVGALDAGQPGPAGTLLYMAPEQFNGAPADSRADVYAAGVLLFELFTLQPPFGGDATTVELGHRMRRPPRPSLLAPVARPLEDVMLRCLAKDPSDRPADAEELRAALTAALAEATGLVSMSASHTAQLQEPDTVASAGTPSATGKARGQRRQTTVAVAFMQTAGDGHQTHAIIEAAGGWLADFSGSRCAVVFTHEATDNPVRRAVEVARFLVDHGLCRRVIVDLASVLVRWRASGQPWFVSSIFSRVERYPTDADPEGVTLTDAMASALPSLGSEASTVHTARAAPRLWQQPVAAMLRSRSAPFVGRADLIAVLLADCRTALSRSLPTLTTITGAPGLGKSRIAGVLAEQLADLNPWVQIRELCAYAPVGGDRTLLLRELLTWALGLPGHSPGDNGRELICQRLGPELGQEAWCGVALAMGWLSPDAPPVRALAAAPGTLRMATARALGEALVRLTRNHAQVLVLDDAQWADDTVLDALEYATAAGRSVGIWCLVLARPVFSEMRPDWGQRAACHHQQQLLPLSREDAHDLCRELLKPALDVPETIIEHLIQRAGRVPMLMVELVRGLVRDGLVKPHEHETGWYVDTDVLDLLPSAPLLDWLTQRELETLTPEQTAHARIVSLLGPEFSADAVDGVLGGLDRIGRASDFPLDARVGLEQLMHCGLLLAHRRGTFSFRHALIRDAVAATVAPASAVDIHRAAYEHYCASAQLTSPDRLARLAWHAEQHGAREAALQAYRAMAEDARGKHDYLRAEQLFTRVLALLDENDRYRRMWAQRGRGIMRYRLSRHDDAIADLASARGHAQALADVETEIDLLLDEAMALDWLGQFDRAAELTQAAHWLSHEVTCPRLEARVLMSLGRAAVRAEDLETAGELLVRAAARAEALGDECYETLVVAQLMLGCVYAWLHRLEEAELVFEQVIGLCRERSDALHLAAALGNRVNLWATRGDWQCMSADLEEHLALAKALGNVRLERNAHLNVATYYYWRGDLEGARKHLGRVLVLDERRGGQEMRPEAPLLLARVELAAGDRDAARSIACDIEEQQALASSRAHRGALLRPTDGLLLNMVMLALRDDADHGAWEDLVSRAEGLSLTHELIEIRDAQARAALCAGDVAAARAAWQAALSLARPSLAFMADRLTAALAPLSCCAAER
jgi:tetratricopeptide (TPR) repeat protein